MSSAYPVFSCSVLGLIAELLVLQGLAPRIPVFRSCAVEPLRFLQIVCAFSTLADGTPETHALERR